MRRRDFIAGIAGSAAAWPVAARAQGGPVRRIGVLTGGNTPNDPLARARDTAFRQRLQSLGWSDGGNVSIEYRWGLGNIDNIRKYAAELVRLEPDVILAVGTVTMAPLLQETSKIPIVFTNVADPVGAGVVDSLARPGGNVTGFAQFEYSLAGKWLELLREIAPSVNRVAVLRDHATTAGIGQLAVIQAVAPQGLEVTPINLRDAGEIERRIQAFTRSENGGLIVTASAFGATHRNQIVELAALHKLPTIYNSRAHVATGGLFSYGPNEIDPHRHAAGYIDRILKGERPSDLPVQAPTKYELVINLKTAKALGIEVPPMLLARADEVIE